MLSMRLLPQKFSVKSYFLGEVRGYGSTFALIVPSFLRRTIHPSLITVLLKPLWTFNLPLLTIPPKCAPIFDTEPEEQEVYRYPGVINLKS